MKEILKNNIKELHERSSITPASFYEKCITERLNESLNDYYEQLEKQFDKMEEKIEKNVVKAAKHIFKKE